MILRTQGRGPEQQQLETREGLGEARGGEEENFCWQKKQEVVWLSHGCLMTVDRCPRAVSFAVAAAPKIASHILGLGVK